MAIPHQLKIGPYNYQVIVSDEIKSDKGEDCWGLSNAFKHQILVSSKIPNDRQKVVLIHELLHALYELQGLPNKSNEETVVTCLAPAIVQVMIENPELAKYVSE